VLSSFRRPEAEKLIGRAATCSGVTPEPITRDETANNSDDSPTGRIQGDDADQQECQHHKGCAALPVAVNLSDDNFGAADEQRTGETHSAELGEPKPVTEPSPIVAEFGHA
jgi:hypothetical protein